MMEVIEDLPENIVGIASHGKITHEDYEHVLIPAVEDKLKDHEKVKLLFHMGSFEGMELVAMWDDMRFGVQHWSDFSHMALVSDEDWVKNMTSYFSWMVPGEIKMFDSGQIGKARAWLAEGEFK